MFKKHSKDLFVQRSNAVISGVYNVLANSDYISLIQIIKASLVLSSFEIHGLSCL